MPTRFGRKRACYGAKLESPWYTSWKLRNIPFQPSLLSRWFFLETACDIILLWFKWSGFLLSVPRFTLEIYTREKQGVSNPFIRPAISWGWPRPFKFPWGAWLVWLTSIFLDPCDCGRFTYMLIILIPQTINFLLNVKYTVHGPLSQCSTLW